MRVDLAAQLAVQVVDAVRQLGERCRDVSCAGACPCSTAGIASSRRVGDGRLLALVCQCRRQRLCRVVNWGEPGCGRGGQAELVQRVQGPPVDGEGDRIRIRGISLGRCPCRCCCCCMRSAPEQFLGMCARLKGWIEEGDKVCGHDLNQYAGRVIHPSIHPSIADVSRHPPSWCSFACDGMALAARVFRGLRATPVSPSLSPFTSSSSIRRL